MGAYLARRLLSLPPVLFAVSVIVFFLLRVMPGDVATMILLGPEGEGTANPAQIAAMRERLGLNEPLPSQYASWVLGLFQFDAGESLWSGQPVMSEIAQRIPLTAELALLSLAVSLAIALPLGIVSALRHNTWVDYVFRVVSIGGLSLPTFWLASLLILALTVYFDWVPPLGYVKFTEDPRANLEILIWPAVILGYNNAATISRLTRSTMIEILREDYVRTARAKGLPLRTVVNRHALRNAAIPVLTLASIELGFLLGGTVVMETVFSLPGVGRLLVDSIANRDYPVVQAVVIMLGTLFVLMNLLVDVIYAALDPRIRYK